MPSTTTLTSEAIHSGSVDTREGGKPSWLRPRVTHGVSSHSPIGKITSSRAASGHQSKRISLIDQATLPITTMA
jgi:hypothetical protein